MACPGFGPGVEPRKSEHAVDFRGLCPPGLVRRGGQGTCICTEMHSIRLSRFFFKLKLL